MFHPLAFVLCCDSATSNNLISTNYYHSATNNNINALSMFNVINISLKLSVC